MDDFRTKLLGFINKQNKTKIPIVGDLPVEDDPNDEEVSSGNDQRPKEPERASDQEILESIDEKYFSKDESFDPSRYELDKYSNLSDVDKIDVDLKKLKQQHLVVSNHVLQMILEKQSACHEEFNRIMEIQSCINEVLKIVNSGRNKLGIATKQFTTASLGILANYRKRTLVQQVLRYLNTLRTLHRTESKMQELLCQGEFPEAISLLLECQSVASSYRHFHCVAALSGKLQDTLVMAEEHLDVALAKVAYDFDEAVYSKIHSAYTLLGKVQIAMDQLLMHYISAIHNAAFNEVHSYVDQDYQTSQKKQYSELCKAVRKNGFIPCLISLCKSLWAIVLSYNQVLEWHQRNIKSSDSNFESNFNEQYVKQKLSSGASRVWHDVQRGVSSLVMAANLEDFKFDDFLQVLGILYRLSQIGEEFCGSESSEVNKSIQTQSSNYFKQYHNSKLDDLRVFLENEAWTPCPVRSDFTLLHLQEFRGLRYSLEQCAGTESHYETSLDGSSVGANFFSRFSDPKTVTPFDSCYSVDSRDEEILTTLSNEPSGYYSEESEEEPDLDYSTPSDGKARIRRRDSMFSGPLLTNTTLTVLRLCGTYLQMSRLLKSIANEVVCGLTQLFEFYLYTVYNFFASDVPNVLCSISPTPKLQTVLNRVKDNLISIEESEVPNNKVLEATISPVVDLTKDSFLHGLSERVVAVESLVFLAKEYTYLRPYLEQLLQHQGLVKLYLNPFYSQTVSACYDVRRPVYACVAWRAINVKQALGLMSKVDWEIKDVMSQHSEYVEIIIKELQLFHTRIKKIALHFPLPDEVVKCLWENVSYLLAHIFVEGFSSSKKCSHGGRALMQLDFTQLAMKAEEMSTLRPLPHREVVEAYVKAYYQLEEDLEVWIKERNDYSSKQLIALVSCACQTNKKLRQKLIAAIEDNDKASVR